MKLLAATMFLLNLMFSLPATATESVRELGGEFVSVAHPTEGRVSIVKDAQEKYYVVLSEDFKTDQGPDLFLVLHKDKTPETYTASNYLSLGRLRKVQGLQVYALPNGIKPDSFESVVVWCKEFNVNFGIAELK